jgi:hypothetical protein
MAVESEQRFAGPGVILLIKQNDRKDGIRETGTHLTSCTSL